MINPKRNIGLKIRTLRHKQDKSQSEIASQLNISVPAFSKIETGITDMSVSRLIQIAELFSVTPATLLSDGDIMEAVTEKYQQYDQKIAELQEHIVSIQSKLINAYETVEQLKSSANKSNQ